MTTFYFGKGTILITGMLDRMVITVISKPVTIEKTYTEKPKDIDILCECILHPTMYQLNSLKKSLLNLENMEDKRVEFLGYILDFNTYNSGSIKSSIIAIDAVSRYLSSILAV